MTPQSKAEGLVCAGAAPSWWRQGRELLVDMESWNPGLYCYGFFFLILEIGWRIIGWKFVAINIRIMWHHKLNLCCACCFSRHFSLGIFTRVLEIQKYFLFSLLWLGKTSWHPGSTSGSFYLGEPSNKDMLDRPHVIWHRQRRCCCC